MPNLDSPFRYIIARGAPRRPTYGIRRQADLFEASVLAIGIADCPLARIPAGEDRGLAAAVIVEPLQTANLRATDGLRTPWLALPCELTFGTSERRLPRNMVKCPATIIDRISRRGAAVSGLPDWLLRLPYSSRSWFSSRNIGLRFIPARI